MVQGSGSSNSASKIVDEEALGLIGKSKGKEKKKKDGKKNLDMSKVKCFICHKQVLQGLVGGWIKPSHRAG